MKEAIEDENVSQTVGEILRDARLKKGKTLRDAADDLCIRRFYLESIEKMEIDNLPPRPYNVGFIRSYAEYLNLNAERIVSSYKSAAAINTDKDNNLGEYTDETTEAFRPKIRHVILGLCGLAVLIFLWTFLKNDKVNVEDLTTTETETTGVVPEPEIISESDEIQNTASDAEYEIPLEQKDNTTADVPEEKSENDTTDTVAENHLKIKLTGPSWLELKQGNKTLLSGIYKKDFEFEIPNGENTVISVGRHQNVQFYVEGELTPLASAMKKRNILLDSFFKKKN